MAMLPRLDAQERLMDMNVHAIAAGTMESADARKLLARLDAASGGAPARRQKAGPAVLAAMGIAVSDYVPAEKPETDDV